MFVLVTFLWSMKLHACACFLCVEEDDDVEAYDL